MKKNRRPQAFRIAAIGASAGGLKAFAELLEALPPAPGMAFVLVPHLAPQFKSHLTEILSRSARMPVREIKNGDRVAPNRVYVVPPNRRMTIVGGVLRLSAIGADSSRHNPIDGFFRSLAEDRGASAVGVLLSGAGSDGTEGLEAIKKAGGATFAQDGETAAYLSMPNSAVASGCVDFVLSPAGIGRKLVRSRGAAPAPRATNHRTKIETALEEILERVHASKGIDFQFYNRSTLRRRVQRRMDVLGLRDPEKYARLLKSDAKETDQLFGELLIHVTSFFREPESFRALKAEIYPRMMKNRRARSTLRIWVPGCSTGEEAYSHAINLAEYLGGRFPETRFLIFATDVNPAVIEKARIGSYSRKEMLGVSEERRRRFFVVTEDGYRIAPAIRERCVFATQNLVQNPPFTNMDLISCRNLLIYLGPTLQDKALQIFQYALKPRAILMLGRSESIGEFSGRFTALDSGRKIFSERTSVLRTHLDFVRSRRFLETESAFKEAEHGKTPPDGPSAGGFELLGELESVLPPRYVPNGVIVNAELEILRFIGDTAPYLRPAPGKPGLNLRRMASGGLLLELRAAIHAAFSSSTSPALVVM